MKKIVFAATALVACLVATAVQAATVTFGAASPRSSSAAEETGGVPPGARVVSFNLTSDADVISIGFVQVESNNPLYQNAAGTNHTPPLDVLVTAIPALGADSWITTPGANTSILGVDMPGDGTANSAWGDLTDDGPQTNFKFAQLTFPKGTIWTFRGNVTVAGSAGPESFDFEFIPEPTSFGLAGLGLMGFAALRRRLA
jgi:hypothetical protein